MRQICGRIYGVFYITQDSKDFSLEDSVPIATSFFKGRADKYARHVFRTLLSEMETDCIKWRASTLYDRSSYVVWGKDGMTRIFLVEPIPFARLDKDLLYS